MLEMGDKTTAAWTAWWILTFSVSTYIYYKKIYHRVRINIVAILISYRYAVIPVSARFIIISLLFLLLLLVVVVVVILNTTVL